MKKVSLWRMISNFFRSKKDKAAEALKDPVRDATYDVEDATEQVRKFEADIQQLMSVNLTNQKRRDAALEEVEKWENIAKIAGKKGNREDVLAAVTSQENAKRSAQLLAAEIETNEKVITKLRDQLNLAKNKIQKAKNDIVVLGARLKSAKVREELSSGVVGLGEGPLSRLDDLNETVMIAESSAEAFEQLNGGSLESLESKYLASDVDIDAKVDSYLKQED